MSHCWLLLYVLSVIRRGELAEYLSDWVRRYTEALQFQNKHYVIVFVLLWKSTWRWEETYFCLT